MYLCSLQVCPAAFQILLDKMRPKRGLQGDSSGQGQERPVPPHPKLCPHRHHGCSQRDCKRQQGTYSASNHLSAGKNIYSKSKDRKKRWNVSAFGRKFCGIDSNKMKRLKLSEKT